MKKETIREVVERAYDEIAAYYTELEGESDRAASILAAAHFEGRLRRAILTKFVPVNKDFEQRVFTNYGPLSTFSGKIDIGFALGLYDNRIRKGLHTIRRIRNQFAHAAKPISFSHEEIAAMSRKLGPKANIDPKDLRKRYIAYLREATDIVKCI